MESFGEILHRVFDDYSIRKIDVAKFLDCSPSLISKWIMSDKKCKVKRPIPNNTKFNRLIIYLRENEVDKSTLQILREASRRERMDRSGIDDTLYPLVKDIDETISIMEEDDEVLNALKLDFEILIYNTQQFNKLLDKINKGIDTFSEIEEELTNRIDDMERTLGATLLANMYFHRGNQRRFLGNMAEAEIDFGKAYNKLDVIGVTDQELAALIKIELADLYRRTEPGTEGWKWIEALRLYEESGEILSKLTVGRLADAQAKRRQSSVWIFAGNPFEGEKLAYESLKICRDNIVKANLSIEEIRELKIAEQKALEHLAWVKVLTGELDKALSYQKEATEIINERSKVEKIESRKLAKYKRYEADIYQACMKYDDAKKIYIYVLELIEEIRKDTDKSGGRVGEEKILKGMALLGLGQLYLRSPKTIEKGIDCLQESLKINRSIEDKLAIGIGNYYLGKAMVQLKKYSEADQYYKKAERIFKLSGLKESKKNEKDSKKKDNPLLIINPYWMIHLEIDLAWLDFIKDNKSESLERLEKVIEWANCGITENLKFPSATIKCYLLKAKTILSEFEHNEIVNLTDLYSSAVSIAESTSTILLEKTIIDIKNQLHDIRKNDEKLLSDIVKKIRLYNQGKEKLLF